MQFCCDGGWSYRFLHILIGAFLLVVMGVFVAVSESDLMEFITERLPDGFLPNSAKRFLTRKEISRLSKKLT